MADENNCAVRWTWPFKASLGNCRDEEEKHYCFPTGDPRPDFLCIGAQKAGTTWLYEQLDSHPDFWMPPFKEIHYFDELSRTRRVFPPRRRDDRDFFVLENMKSLSARSYIDVENYARLFVPKGSLLSGDITPAYSMLNDEIIHRIIDHFPTLKVIFLARDPVARAWSHLSMAVHFGTISPFDVTDGDEVIRNLLNPRVLLRSYPSKIVARWKRYVRPEFFRAYFFDDLQENPVELRRSILLFLGADPDKASGRLKPHDNGDAGREKLRLTAKVRARIARFFEQELKVCAAELGGPAKSWPARYGFSLVLFFWDLADYFDLLLWCDWIA
jgi:hypothetical protein